MLLNFWIKMVNVLSKKYFSSDFQHASAADDHNCHNDGISLHLSGSVQPKCCLVNFLSKKYLSKQSPILFLKVRKHIIVIM